MPKTTSGQLRLESIETADDEQLARSEPRASNQSNRGWYQATSTLDGHRGSAENELTLRQIIGIVSRRRNMVIGVSLVGTVLLLLAAWLASPKYTALAQIEVIKDDAPELRDPRAMQMMIDRHLVLLKSPDFLRMVLESIAARPKEHIAVQKSHEQSTRNTSIDEFEKHLTVNQALSSNVIAIRFTSRNSGEAADVANLIVDTYRTQLEERREARAKDELTDLSKRVEKLKALTGAMQTSKRIDFKNRVSAPAIGTTDQKLNGANVTQSANAAARELVSLLRRQRDLSQQVEAMRPEVRVVTMASPPSKPSSLHPLLFVIPGVVALVAASCFLAIVLEHFDQGLRSSQDIIESLAVPCMGLIPRLRQSRRSEFASHSHVTNHPFSPYTEAIRSVTAAIGLGLPQLAPRVVQFSCSEPGEGKTTLAVAIAGYAASIGHNVLLVDLDVRMPGVLRELKCTSDRSIVDVLNDELTIDSVIERHPMLEFDFLPMTAGAIDPLSLIVSKKLTAIFDKLRSEYDLILVDGPSAIGHSDAGLLAPIADNVIFVVRWGKTRGRVARNAIQALVSQDQKGRPAHEFISAIVTQVPQVAHARYHFGDAVEVLMKHGTRLLPRSYTSLSWKTATRNGVSGAGRTIATLTTQTANRLRDVAKLNDRQ